MHLVKMITDDDGSKHDSKDWHLVQTHGDAQRTVCTGEAFGPGESIATYEEKHTGKITCPNCIRIIKWYKSIKL